MFSILYGKNTMAYYIGLEKKYTKINIFYFSTTTFIMCSVASSKYL